LAGAGTSGSSSSFSRPASWYRNDRTRRQPLSFDRTAVSQTVDPNARLASNIGLGTAVAFAGIDTVLSGFRDGSTRRSWTECAMRSRARIALAVTDLTKIAVRRPASPRVHGAGAPRQELRDAEHAESVPAITSTDTQPLVLLRTRGDHRVHRRDRDLPAFERSPHSPRPWITLVASVLLTGSSASSA